MKNKTKISEQELLDGGYEFCLHFGHCEIWCKKGLSFFWNRQTQMVEFICRNNQ